MGEMPAGAALGLTLARNGTAAVAAAAAVVVVGFAPSSSSAARGYAEAPCVVAACTTSALQLLSSGTALGAGGHRPVPPPCERLPAPLGPIRHAEARAERSTCAALRRDTSPLAFAAQNSFFASFRRTCFPPRHPRRGCTSCVGPTPSDCCGCCRCCPCDGGCSDGVG